MSAPGGSDGVGGGLFEVNIAEAPRAIRELEQARNELASIRDDALRLADVRPPATDDVSVDAARALSQRANGGPQSFMHALDEGIQEIARMVDALRAGLARYQENEDSGRLSFTQ